MEDYAYILDYLAQGTSGGGFSKREPVCYAIGDEEFKLFLCHYPDVFKEAMEDYPVDLALCGHAHGGLIKLPGIGALYSNEQGFFPKLTQGCLQLDGSTVVISRGLGNSSKVPRFNNRPELVVVDVDCY